MMDSSNENPDLCAACGGECCKCGPGIVHPDDLEGDITAAIGVLAIWK